MIPTRIGQKCHGGLVAGIQRDNNTVSALIVAPSELCTTMVPASNPIEFDISLGQIPGSPQFNSDLVKYKFNAAEYCASITSYSDWFLPSVEQLLIATVSSYNACSPGVLRQVKIFIESAVPSFNVKVLKKLLF